MNWKFSVPSVFQFRPQNIQELLVGRPQSSYWSLSQVCETLKNHVIKKADTTNKKYRLFPLWSGSSGKKSQWAIAQATMVLVSGWHLNSSQIMLTLRCLFMFLCRAEMCWSFVNALYYTHCVFPTSSSC